ncbi:MAG: hypothetical protein IJC17_05625 [Clostridia bacterium]|nr:hypothetical protein [Clostridia bacterium]
MKLWKKIAVVTVAMLLLCQVMGVTAFAEGEDPAAVTVSLTGEITSAVEGSEYEVALELDQTNVGGVQGVVTYDKALFSFQSVSMTSTMAAVNHLDGADENGLTTAGDVITHDAENGTISFALLADSANTDAEWVTFRFTAIAEATAAISTANFTLSEVVVSNAAGTKAIATATTEDLSVVVADTALEMEGSTIRTNGEYDLRYELTLPQAFLGLENVTKVGVVLVPTSLVKAGAELQNDPSGESFCVKNGSGTQVKPNIAELTMDYIKANQEEGATDYKIYANITKTAASHMKRLYSLRGYAVVEVDGTEYTVYADNEDAETNIADGTASRSCQSTAIALYEKYVKGTELDTAEIQEIIGRTNWSAEDYEAVVEANCQAYMAGN